MECNFPAQSAKINKNILSQVLRLTNRIFAKISTEFFNYNPQNDPQFILKKIITINAYPYPNANIYKLCPKF